MVTDDQLDLICSIFNEVEEAHEKISVKLCEATKTMTVDFWDLDFEDFAEMKKMIKEKK